MTQAKANAMHLDLLGGKEDVVQFAGRDNAAPEIDKDCIGDGCKVKYLNIRIFSFEL